MTKTLLVGLDAACWEYLDPLLGSEELPTIKGLMNGGVWGTLHSTMPPWTPTAWASIVTGKNPGKHGIFDMLWRKPASYEFTPTNSRSRRGTPFWGYLNALGIRVGLVNIPFTYPPEEMDGFIVCGFGTPSSVGDVAFPDEALRWIRNNVQDFKPTVESDFLRNAPPEAVLDGESRHQANQVKIALHLAEKYAVDVLAINLMLTDHANHKMPFVDQVDEAYRRSDVHLSELIEGFQPDNILLISDHGSSRLKGDFLLNAWLRDKGLTKYHVNTRSEQNAALNWILTQWSQNLLGRRDMLGKATRKILREVSLSLPQRWQQRFWNYLNDLIPFAHEHVLFSNRVDYAHSKVFPGSVYSGLLYLNIAHREPTGTIPSEERREIVHQLVEDLREIQEPETGRPLFSNVYTSEGIYSGAALEFAPDIVLDSYSTNWNIRTSKHIPVKESAKERYFIDVARRSDFGWHSRDGIYIFSGQGFRVGRETVPAQLYDVTATLLNLYGVAIPEDFDGIVLRELLVPEAGQREIHYQGGDTNGGWQPENSLTAEESEELADHLRALGYLD